MFDNRFGFNVRLAKIPNLFAKEPHCNGGKHATTTLLSWIWCENFEFANIYQSMPFNARISKKMVDTFHRLNQ